ncbi:MAG: response regulator [Deltaproteobacteria bacterium]|nr:response regulator [Deltaproteobacteria bacterium]
MWSPTIYVLTPDRPAREALRDALGAEHYEVTELEDGPGVLERVERVVPDLLVLDLELGETSGGDLLGQLRSVPGCDDLAAIGISRSGAGAAGGGFSKVVPVPFDRAELLLAVRSQLPVVLVGDELSGDGRRVLAVDDDPTQLRLLRIHLTSLGFRVTTAADGRSAALKARDDPPDAIVSDILMPGLDGFGLCLEVRRDPKLARIPIVLQSSHYVEEADRLLAQGVGANRMVVRTSGIEPARLVLELLGSTGSWTARPVIGIEREHSQRLARQLQRQLEENRALAARCADLTTLLQSMSAEGQALDRKQNADPVLRDVFAGSLEAAGVGWGALYAAGQGGALDLRFSIGYPADRTAELGEFFGHAAELRQVAASGTVLSITSASAADEGARDLLERAGVSSILVLPIVAGESGMGLLFLGSRGAQVKMGPSVRALGSHIGEALGLVTALERLAGSEERHRQVLETTGDAAGPCRPPR